MFRILPRKRRWSESHDCTTTPTRYLLKYDTVMRIFQKEVTADADAIYVDGKKVVMTEEKDPGKIPWGRLGVQIVVESTGVHTSRASLEPHLAAGAKRVILTVPPKDELTRSS